jgi:sterol desaturase/sphingolipid hydroxylase (fatty acid hydroxylase superfamily)
MIIQTFIDYFAQVQDLLFEAVVQPTMLALDLGQYLEEAFSGTEWFLIGICELTVLYVVLRPLEALIPVHRIVGARARLNDFAYTVLNRLGILTVVVFFMLDPLVNMLMEQLHLYSVHPLNLDDLWPGITDQPVVTFLLYLVVLDFFDYWYHRAQHNVPWMWALHSLHHSQQNMNLWSDDRNHLLDVFVRDVLMGLVALAIGVAPSQYVLVVVASRMLQSLQHANIRLHFGRWGDYLVVSPRFHRLHHAIGIGHESQGPDSLGGCNYAVLFTVWDMLFRSARFGSGFALTGVRDQLPPPHGKGRDYGDTFWLQQWLGCKRLAKTLFRKRSV